MWIIRFFALLLVLSAVGMAVLYAAVRHSATLQPTEPADVIIVLGSGSSKGKPSPVYAARLDHARKLFERGLAPRIIVTEKAPAAQDAQRYLLAHGVQAQSILLEDRSTTTWENLKFSKEIMDRHGWRSAIVVSCPFHLFRGLQMCRELRITAQGAGSDSPLEKTAESRLRYTLIECRKYLAYKVLGIR